jgi:non-ribosomal peptide synthetase component F
MSIIDLFQLAAKTHKDVAAILFGERSLSYTELDKYSLSVATYLQRIGVEQDSSVAIYIPRSIELVVAILGVLRSGACYVPLETTYPSDRLATTFKNCEAKVLLTSRSCLSSPLIQSLASQTLLFIENLLLENISGYRKPENEDRLAYILYTSGSTGKPKGIEMPQRALNNMLQWQLRESSLTARHGARTLQFSPVGFDVSFQEIFATICFDRR